MGGNYVFGHLNLSTKSVHRAWRKGGAINLHAHFGRRLPAAFHLPEVSRQIYSETATLAYHTNTFAVDHMMMYKGSEWTKCLLSVQKAGVTAIAPTGDAVHYYFRPALNRTQIFTDIFPNLRRVEISKSSVEVVRMYECEDDETEDDSLKKRLRGQWQEEIATKIREADGDKIDIIFEEGPEFAPYRSEDYDETRGSDDSEEAESDSEE
jgi:hypothetical protein